MVSVPPSTAAAGAVVATVVAAAAVVTPAAAVVAVVVAVAAVELDAVVLLLPQAAATNPAPSSNAASLAPCEDLFMWGLLSGWVCSFGDPVQQAPLQAQPNGLKLLPSNEMP